MYRTTAATGGSHPQHILLLETHIFPAKCQLGEEIKVSQGLAAAPVGSEFHTNERICSSISHPLGMSHRGLHPPSPARAAPRPLSTGFGSTTSCALSSSATVPGCTWGATGCPQGCPLTMMGCTGAAALRSLHQLLSRAAAHTQVLEVPPSSWAGRDRVQ